MALNFEWDDQKAAINLGKHAVSFEEAASVFEDPDSITIADPAHSAVEQRAVTLGSARNGRILVVVYTERGDVLRIISARPASRKERRQYVSIP